MESATRSGCRERPGCINRWVLLFYQAFCGFFPFISVGPKGITFLSIVLWPEVSALAIAICFSQLILFKKQDFFLIYCIGQTAGRDVREAFGLQMPFLMLGLKVDTA